MRLLAVAYRKRIENGAKATGTKLTIGRKLIDTLSALWRNGEEYDPERVVVK